MKEKMAGLREDISKNMKVTAKSKRNLYLKKFVRKQKRNLFFLQKNKDVQNKVVFGYNNFSEVQQLCLKKTGF